MEDFEDKYSLLIKYMLPHTNKCIESVEFDGFVSEYEVLGIISNPKDEFEPETRDMLNGITPKINVKGVDKWGKRNNNPTKDESFKRVISASLTPNPNIYIISKPQF